MLTKPYTIATTVCLVKNQSFPIKVIEPVNWFISTLIITSQEIERMNS